MNMKKITILILNLKNMSSYRNFFNTHKLFIFVFLKILFIRFKKFIIKILGKKI